MTETKTKIVTPGSDVTWSVSADGFDTQSGTFDDISESQSLDIYLLGSYGTIEKTVKDVQVNDDTSWILLTDGTLWGCGSNSSGQQGSGDTTNVTSFTQRLTDVKEISCTETNSWALKTDGTLWGCGSNYYGQQGAGTSGSGTNVTTFTQRMTDVEHVYACSQVTWALKTDGTLWGCGRNIYGQQGSGEIDSNDENPVTTFTQRLTDVSKLFISKQYGFETWAVKTDGTLWGCGRGLGGQQGNGSTNDVTTFTQRLTDVKDVILLGEYYNGMCDSTWVIKNDNTLWGCGYNANGSQGSGQQSEEVKIFTQRLTDVIKVSCSMNTTWALKTDGTLWGCGTGSYGQQGDGSTSYITTFTKRLTEVRDVFASQDETWALKTDGTLWICGRNTYGQQGNGSTDPNDRYYVKTFTQRLNDVKKLCCNVRETWAIKTDGTLWGCGYNDTAQQGSGGTTDVTYLTQRLTDVKEVFHGIPSNPSVNVSYATWALKTDGTLWGCGNNSKGQQGSGNTTDVTTFTKRNPSITGYNSAKLTINSTPADATVTINSTTTSSADIRKGTSAEWSVSKTGYETQSGTISHIYDDTTLNINLEEE